MEKDEGRQGRYRTKDGKKECQYAKNTHLPTNTKRENWFEEKKKEKNIGMFGKNRE